MPKTNSNKEDFLNQGQGFQFIFHPESKVFLVEDFHNPGFYHAQSFSNFISFIPNPALEQQISSLHKEINSLKALLSQNQSTIVAPVQDVAQPAQSQSLTQVIPPSTKASSSSLADLCKPQLLCGSYIVSGLNLEDILLYKGPRGYRIPIEYYNVISLIDLLFKISTAIGGSSIYLPLFHRFKCLSLDPIQYSHFHGRYILPSFTSIYRTLLQLQNQPSLFYKISSLVEKNKPSKFSLTGEMVSKLKSLLEDIKANLEARVGSEGTLSYSELDSLVYWYILSNTTVPQDFCSFIQDVPLKYFNSHPERPFYSKDLSHYLVKGLPNLLKSYPFKSSSKGVAGIKSPLDAIYFTQASFESTQGGLNLFHHIYDSVLSESLDQYDCFTFTSSNPKYPKTICLFSIFASYLDSQSKTFRKTPLFKWSFLTQDFLLHIAKELKAQGFDLTSQNAFTNYGLKHLYHRFLDEFGSIQALQQRL